MKTTEYFEHMRKRPDRARIREEWIAHVIQLPEKTEVRSSVPPRVRVEAHETAGRPSALLFLSPCPPSVLRREAEVDTMTATRSRKVPVPEGEIAAFCRRWEITELALFGSVLKENFGPESDVDLLVTFFPDARWTLFDLVKMQEELATIFGREVDLVSRRGLDMSRNYLRRNAILSGSEVIYAA